MIAEKNLDQLRKAVADLRHDIDELEAEFGAWVSENVNGTKRYRPIAKRIVLLSKRLQELVTENTYSP